MTWLAEAHRDWHAANGQNVTCPLDCGAGERDFWQCPTCGDYLDEEADCLKVACVQIAEARVKYAAAASMLPTAPAAWEPPF